VMRYQLRYIRTASTAGSFILRNTQCETLAVACDMKLYPLRV